MVLKKFPGKLIGEILIEEGFLKPENLKKGLEIQKKEGGLIGEILVRMGWVTEDELIIGLSKQLSLPFIKLSSYNVNRNVLKFIPREIAQRYLLFPFEQDGQQLSLAMANPLDQEAIGKVEKQVSLEIQLFLASSSEIKKAIKYYYSESLTSNEGR